MFHTLADENVTPQPQYRPIPSPLSTTITKPSSSLQLKSMAVASISGTKNVPTSTILSSGMPKNLTIYGYVDTQLEDTIHALRRRNVGIVIREESEMLRILKENKKRKLQESYIGKGKEKEDQGVAKGKENQSPYINTPYPESTKRTLGESYTGEGKDKEKQCSGKRKENQCPYITAPSPEGSTQRPISRYTLARHAVYLNSFGKRQKRQEKLFPGLTPKRPRYRPSQRDNPIVIQPIPFSLDIDFDEITPLRKKICLPRTLPTNVVDSQQHFQSQPNPISDTLGLHEIDIVQSLPCDPLSSWGAPSHVVQDHTSSPALTIPINAR